MALFQAKIGWKRPGNRENKNYRSVPLQPEAKQKIPKKQQKNSKIPLWLLFMPKIGWKSPRKSESKNYRSVPLLPYAQQKIKKKQQKNSKN